MPRTQGRDPRLRLYAVFDGGSGRAHRLAAGAGAIGRDERRRNASVGGGSVRAHGLDAGAGACFWQSRAGTARASSTQILRLEYWLNFTSKFKFKLCFAPELAMPACSLTSSDTIAAATIGKNHSASRPSKIHVLI